jgi:ABC-type multidrug transport system ATPase subunit
VPKKQDNNIMISAKGLRKSYGDFNAVDGIDFEVKQGEAFGLLGPNGAGKSSLMRTIATLQTPDSGKVVFNGIDIANDPMSLRKTLGYLPQEFGVYPKESAENRKPQRNKIKGMSTLPQLLEMIAAYC